MPAGSFADVKEPALTRPQSFEVWNRNLSSTTLYLQAIFSIPNSPCTVQVVLGPTESAPVFQNSVSKRCPPGDSTQQLSAGVEVEHDTANESRFWAEQTVRPVPVGVGATETEVEVDFGRKKGELKRDVFRLLQQAI